MKIPKFKSNLKIGLFSVTTFIFIVLLLARPPWDPDLGWHLRNGQDILRLGAPKGDLYSHTMFGYSWISHEWLTDALLYLSSHYLGLIFLSLAFALIAFFAYFISARVAKVRIESTLITVLIAALVALPIVGVRPQMLTLLGLAIVLWILFRWRDNPQSKLIYWLIPLMLVWVNMHGGFAAGLILIGVFGVIELIKYLFKKFRIIKIVSLTMSPIQLWKLAGVGIVSFAVTFINPYTWRIYDELFRTIFNDLVRQGISEWMPIAFNNSQSYNLIIYIVFMVVLLIFSWKKVDSTKIWIGAVFLLISLNSWRNMPLFPLVTLPLLSEMIEALSPKGIYYHLRSVWMIGLAVVLLFCVGYDRYHTIVPVSTNEALFSTIYKYPYNAVQYIKENKLPGKMFNEYNWGGYLIWRLPEKKVFIDGRMAIWQTENQNIFEEYLVLSGAIANISTKDEDIAAILDKYEINLALIYKDRPFKDYFLEHNNKWMLVYGDSLALIFQRIDSINNVN